MGNEGFLIPKKPPLSEATKARRRQMAKKSSRGEETKARKIQEQELPLIENAPAIEKTDKKAYRHLESSMQAIQNLLDKRNDIFSLTLEGKLSLNTYPIDKISFSNESHKLQNGALIMIPTVSVTLTRKILTRDVSAENYEYRIMQEILALIEKSKGVSVTPFEKKDAAQIRMRLYWTARDTSRSNPKSYEILMSETYALVPGVSPNEIITASA